MASGALCANESREKRRWGENNEVYTRKIHNKGIKSNSNTTITTTNHSNNESNNPQQCLQTLATEEANSSQPQQSLSRLDAHSDVLGVNESREKRRWGENNEVYTRKIHNKGIKSNSNTTITTTNHSNNESNNVPAQCSQTLATEETNSSQPQQTLSRLDAHSDVSSKHNQETHFGVPNGCELPNGNGVNKPVVTKVDNRVKINLAAARLNNEIEELRRKLGSELDEVRSLVKVLEAREVQLNGYSTATGGSSHLLHSANDVINKAHLVMVNSDACSVAPNDSGPFQQLSVSVMENNHGVGEFAEKDKRTPKANTYYQNSDFVLGKERLPTHGSNKKLKSSGGRKLNGEIRGGFAMDMCMSQAFKSCSDLLTKLMKNKHAWVFNKPVDAKALGLHDYDDVIEHPMDLGTVMSKLAKNWYKSPREFAEDVRLTFRNAMTYNPKGQDVHAMAEQSSLIFEEEWAVIEAKYNLGQRFDMVYGIGMSSPTSRKSHLPFAPPPQHALDKMSLDRSESMKKPVDAKLKPSNFARVGRTPVPKKPKAKDTSKRDMTYEEKQRLSTNLQRLPSEKLDNIVQIIKKSNSALCQHDDEIEVDIDSLDAETLWDLDRCVTNYKKNLSKKKRKAELAFH
ncbi:transcription factor GTE4-like [Cornus florida]|uniref:transcription factor GTE4-like n=1 Tax=Cornus florida TaxID=4283 RepID=UPI0028998D02|nr:transcription factor GTE4-like [Cornus florida]